MRSRRNHMGTGFEVWTGEHTWFWFVIKPHRNGGTFGAAATEALAVHEACLSIEQMSAQRRADAADLLVTSITLAGWEGSLANLERYLNSVCHTAA